jgi:hypothetical protein
MTTRHERYAALAAEIDALRQRREQAIAAAFDELERHDGRLADLLVTTLSTRRRAAHWMCQPLRQLGGANAYEALAEGNDDAVWELLVAQAEHDLAMSH